MNQQAQDVIWAIDDKIMDYKGVETTKDWRTQYDIWPRLNIKLYGKNYGYFAIETNDNAPELVAYNHLANLPKTSNIRRAAVKIFDAAYKNGKE